MEPYDDQARRRENAVDAAAADDAAPPPRPPRRSRGRVWLRRAGIGILGVFVVVTGFSLVFNLLTKPPATIEPGFGAYAHVGSSSVHYEKWGTSGIPIVLVPGFLESTTAWSRVGPILGRDHVVYAIDLPGDGYTRYTGSADLADETALVDGFIHAVHLDKPIVVGHSMGAAIVGSVALSHPGDIRKVIFADGDGLAINLPPKFVRSSVLASPYPTTLLRIGIDWTSVVRSFITQACGPHCPAISTAFTRQWVRPLRQASDEHALKQLLASGVFALSPAQISAITTPAAIIWGSADQQGGSLAKTRTNLHNPPVHVIEGAGHLSMLADPTAFAQAVDAG